MKLIVCSLILSLVACAPKTTTNTTPLPVPGHIMVADKTLSDICNTAVKALRTARQNNQITDADLATAYAYITPLVKMADAVADELITNDTGTVLKTKLLNIVANATLASVANISPNAAAIVSQVTVALQQLQSLIGGI